MVQTSVLTRQECIANTNYIMLQINILTYKSAPLNIRFVSNIWGAYHFKGSISQLCYIQNINILLKCILTLFFILTIIYQCFITATGNSYFSTQLLIMSNSSLLKLGSSFSGYSLSNCVYLFTPNL